MAGKQAVADEATTTSDGTLQIDDKRRRRSAHDRRHQLLDAAGQVLLEKGRAGFTMEAVAVAAGVSKALPYRHFANGNEAMRALFRREVGGLVVRLGARAAEATTGDEALAAIVDEYFHAVAERGALLSVLAGPGSDIPDVTGDGQENRQPPEFLVVVLTKHYGLRRAVAVPLAAVVVAAVIAASDSAGRGEVTANQARQLATDVVLGAVERTVAKRTRLRAATTKS